jgi:glycosyltransferase involved in cell wall biosynthesis
VEQVFLQSRAVPRGKWLVCTATITQRKRVLELAEAAVQAQTPLWVIGKPYSEADDYGGRFLAFAAAHPELLRYQGPLNDRARLAGVYREARGFVLLSTMETRSLAAEEAAACECPLLLSELPWARSVFGERAAYAAPGASKGATAERLRWFYDAAPQLPVPPKPISWLEVGRQLCRIYAGL